MDEETGPQRRITQLVSTELECEPRPPVVEDKFGICHINGRSIVLSPIDTERGGLISGR